MTGERQPDIFAEFLDKLAEGVTARDQEQAARARQELARQAEREAADREWAAMREKQQRDTDARRQGLIRLVPIVAKALSDSAVTPDFVYSGYLGQMPNSAAVRYLGKMVHSYAQRERACDLPLWKLLGYGLETVVKRQWVRVEEDDEWQGVLAGNKGLIEHTATFWDVLGGDGKLYKYREACTSAAIPAQLDHSSAWGFRDADELINFQDIIARFVVGKGIESQVQESLSGL